MNFAAATGHRLGRATPCLRDTPQRKLMGTTGRRSTYRRRNAVQANPATSERMEHPYARPRAHPLNHLSPLGIGQCLGRLV